MPSQSFSHPPLSHFERPSCPRCGTRMMLARIEADKPDYDKRTFECPECQHSESLIVKYR
jgi:DNA-directed RNA polymerase subunit RPC12/RpoP